MLCKQHWQVGLFQWIKQYFRIADFPELETIDGMMKMPLNEFTFEY